jgi:ribosome production factor 1
MFKSTEKAALQEIGPRFTLKLRWLKKDIPAVRDIGAAPPRLALAEDDAGDENMSEQAASDGVDGQQPPSAGVKVLPPKEDEFIWMWKVSRLCSAPLRI